jgi:hypothetical protein
MTQPNLTLPEDLRRFLGARRQLDYDASACEAGLVTLQALADLKWRYFPFDPQGTELETKDPRRGQGGCYLIKAFSLVKACSPDYEPDGLLLWIPEEERYGVWDPDHAFLGVFGPEVTWDVITKAPARYINAQWKGMFADAAAVECLEAWKRHDWFDQQAYTPVDPDDLVE